MGQIVNASEPSGPVYLQGLERELGGLLCVERSDVRESRLKIRFRHP